MGEGKQRLSSKHASCRCEQIQHNCKSRGKKIGCVCEKKKYFPIVPFQLRELEYNATQLQDTVVMTGGIFAMLVGEME